MSNATEPTKPKYFNCYCVIVNIDNDSTGSNILEYTQGVYNSISYEIGKYIQVSSKNGYPFLGIKIESLQFIYKSKLLVFRKFSAGEQGRSMR